MSEAQGNHLYALPTEREGDQWTGNIKSIGGLVEVNTTYRKCNIIIYNDSDILDTVMYKGEMVHKLWFQNITKIEGVY